MTERENIGPDRIEKITRPENGDPVVETVMDTLPKGLINYGARPESAENPTASTVLPEPITRLDLRGMRPGGDASIVLGLAESEKPHVATVDQNGIARVEVGQGQEYVIFAGGLVDRVKRTEVPAAPFKSVNPLTRRTELGTEGGGHHRHTAAAQDRVVWAPRPAIKGGKTSM